jgi:hypothetical protein
MSDIILQYDRQVVTIEGVPSSVIVQQTAAAVEITGNPSEVLVEQTAPAIILEPTTQVVIIEPTAKGIIISGPTSGTSETAPVAAGVSFSAACSIADIVGNGVYVSGPRSGGLITVRTVDITDSAKMPCVGIIESKSSDTSCTVRTDLELTDLPFAFTVGKRVFVTNSGLSTTRPSGSG